MGHPYMDASHCSILERKKCNQNGSNSHVHSGVRPQFTRYNPAIMNHPSSAIKVIFFDLGSTLIYSKDLWPPIYEKADRALVEVLHQAGIPIELTPFCCEFGSFLDSYYAKRGAGTVEKTTFSLLTEILDQKGFTHLPPSTIRSALDAMYSITQQNWYLESDAVPTLKILREAGYRLGMISNTSDDENVQQLVDRCELRPYFDVILTSAGCGIRKPDEHIFHLALDFFGLPAEQTAMVGDMLEADILGANQLGMYSIWITRRAEVPEEGELKIQPQAIITALDQVPDLLGDLEEDEQ
jgi:HAD superfamily hydrolase (TIGR01662 family)